MIQREYILSEIKRTAAENGGVPLASRRFYLETGIKVADWFGKHWARWSDALDEAGFPPNVLQGSYDETLILQKLASLIREHGHFPVLSELRMKKRSDPSFPNDKTLDKLGSKHQKASRVLQFCEQSGGYDDVVEICKPLIAPPPDVEHKTSDSPIVFGEVYLMRSGRYHKLAEPTQSAAESANLQSSCLKRLR